MFTLAPDVLKEERDGVKNSSVPELRTKEFLKFKEAPLATFNLD